MKFAELLVLLESDGDTVQSVKVGDKVFYYPDETGFIRTWRLTAGECATSDRKGYLHTSNTPAIARVLNHHYSGGPFRKEFMKIYAKHGKFHRLDGPAVTVYDYSGYYNTFKSALQHIEKLKEKEEYWINGKEYTKEEFEAFKKDINPEDIDILSDLGQTFE